MLVWGEQHCIPDCRSCIPTLWVMGTLGGKESEFRVLWVSAWGPAPALFSTSTTGSGSPSCSEKGDSQAELGCLSQRAAAHKGFQPQHGSHSAQPGAGGSLQRRQQGEVCRQCLCVRSLLLRFSWDFSVGEICNPSQPETIPTSFLSIPPLLCCHHGWGFPTCSPSLAPGPHIFHSACPCPGRSCPPSAAGCLLHSIPLLRHHLQLQTLSQVLWPNGV